MIVEKFSKYVVPSLESLNAKADKGEIPQELFKELIPLFVGMSAMLLFIKSVEERAPGASARAEQDMLVELKREFSGLYENAPEEKKN